MSNMLIKGFPKQFYNKIQKLAEKDNLSFNQEILNIIHYSLDLEDREAREAERLAEGGF